MYAHVYVSYDCIDM